MSATSDGTLTVSDVLTGRVRERFRGHAGEVNAVVLSPDGATAYTAGDDGLVIIWDLQGDRRLGRVFDRGAGATVFSQIFALSPDGSVLAVPTEEGAIHLWDLDEWTLISEFPGHNEGLTSGLSFSPDGRTLAATGTYGTVDVWDVGSLSTTGESFPLPPGQVGWWTTFSPDGSMLAVSASPPSGELSTFIVWDVTSRRVLTEFEIAAGGGSEIDFSPDGRYLSAATCCESGFSRIRILEVDGWQELPAPEPEGWLGHTDFSADGRVLVLPDERKITFWDVPSGSEAAPSIPGLGFVWGFAISPDARLLAAAEGSGGRVLLWDLRARTQIGPGLPIDRAAALEFTPDGRHLVIVEASEKASVWDVAPDALVRHACMLIGRNLTRETWADLTAQPYERVCAQSEAETP